MQVSKYIGVIMSVAALVSLSTLQATPAFAQAGCTTDIQCKGDRICVSGRCQSPGQPVAPAAPPPPGQFTVDSGQNEFLADPGWTKGAAIAGFVATGVGTALGIAAVGTIDGISSVPSTPLGAAATLIFGVTMPIVASGGGSGSESGPLALRIIGWIMYGVTLINAIPLVVLGAIDADVEESTSRAIAAGSTAAGFISGMSFSFNALIASNRSNDPGYAAVERNDDAPAISAVVGRIRDRDANPISTLGFRLEF